MPLWGLLPKLNAETPAVAHHCPIRSSNLRGSFWGNAPNAWRTFPGARMLTTCPLVAHLKNLSAAAVAVEVDCSGRWFYAEFLGAVGWDQRPWRTVDQQGRQAVSLRSRRQVAAQVHNAVFDPPTLRAGRARRGSHGADDNYNQW